MISLHKDTIQFLKELKLNNNREWFNENKERYKEIRGSFISFLESVYPYFCEFDPDLIGIDLRKSVFRINRDVRFSKDKSPYKTSIAGVIIAGGRRNFSEKAGYYLHIEPGKSIIAGGAYLPPSNWINRVRKDISADAKTFRDIICEANFVKYFGGLTGEQLRSSPRGFDKDDPNLDLLKYKSYLAVNNVTNKEVLSESLAKHFINVAKATKALNDFLNSESS